MLSFSMPLMLRVAAVLLLAIGRVDPAERINHEGRILGPAPVVTNAVLFNSSGADAIVSAMQIFPRDNAWSEDITRRPLLSNSDAMINRIISDLAADRRTLRPFYEMNFVLVPDSQPLVPIEFVEYPEESDDGPYPIPTNMPVESWPKETEGQNLYDWQRDINDWGGDRHSIIVQPGSGFVWETWQSLMVVTGGRTNWQAGNGAKFSLNSNALRPLGWTSADAGGLSMFGGLVRYDECERGMVEHAIRLIVRRTRREYIYPATHYASTLSATNVNVPAMGQRLRLKSGFVIPDHWTKQEKAVLRGLRKYGAIVADNGNFFSISVAPDHRFATNAFDNLSSISITNFEVIQTTPMNGGPRSPGAPVVDAGQDQTAAVASPVTLQGSVIYTNGGALAVQWKRYSGPPTLTFADATSINSTVSFGSPGFFTLILSADDGVHAVAYDAVNITVTPGVHVQLSRTSTNLTLQWTGGNPPYLIEQATSLPGQWSSYLTTNSNSVTLPLDQTTAFFRVQAQ